MYGITEITCSKDGTRISAEIIDTQCVSVESAKQKIVDRISSLHAPLDPAGVLQNLIDESNWETVSPRLTRFLVAVPNHNDDGKFKYEIVLRADGFPIAGL